MGLFSLEDQLAFYGNATHRLERSASIRTDINKISTVLMSAFHHNKWNQLIHLIFVPLILWTSMIFFILLTPSSISDLTAPDMVKSLLPFVNLSVVIGLGYGLYYIALDRMVGSVYSVLLYVMYLTSNSFVANNPNALLIGIALHVLSWYMQIHVGHLMLEKRRPALTHSFFQSLVLAPIFTFFEVIFALGFRKRLYERVTRRAVANIKQFNAGVPAEKLVF